MFVAHFDQHLGAEHSQHWLIYEAEVRKKKQKIAAKFGKKGFSQFVPNIG